MSATPRWSGWRESNRTVSLGRLCLTGLTVVDTGRHWSGFGHGVILGLRQLGGLGIMTLASVLALLMAGRLGVRARLHVVAEARSVGVGDVRRVLTAVAKASLMIEPAHAPAILLLPGATPAGRDDERVVSLASSLAAAGREVVVP